MKLLTIYKQWRPNIPYSSNLKSLQLDKIQLFDSLYRLHIYLQTYKQSLFITNKPLAYLVKNLFVDWNIYYKLGQVYKEKLYCSCTLIKHKILIWYIAV